MKLKWPKLNAELTPHTVTTPRGILAGYLVRDTWTGKDLGYVASVGSTWRWQLPDGQHYGERSTQEKAIEVLRDAYDLAKLTTGRLPFTADEAGNVTPPRLVVPPMKPRRLDPIGPAPKQPRPIRVAKTEPPEPVRKVDWNTVTPMGDVTAALADALRKKE